MNDALNQFADEKYLNLESYRKNGSPVLTPVWFAQADPTLFIYSLADAGKVKRIRNNPQVRVAPCDFRGKLKGEWVGGRARIIDGTEANNADRLLDQKYGLVRKLGGVFSKLRGNKRAFIAIELA